VMPDQSSLAPAGDSHKAIYEGIIEAIGRGDPAALDDLMSPDFVDHNPLPGQASGRDGFKEWMAAARASFPDLVGTVEEVVAENDRVAARMTWRGTHRGTFAGVTATNKRVSMSAFHIVRFEDGQAVEWWGTADLFGALQQLGATVSGPQ
jgi:steroid delta-isomerase-like uncharacterized protein